MARKIKVYGSTAMVPSEVIAALGDQRHHRQCSVVVAARSATEAARLCGMTHSEFTHSGGETWNQPSIEIAMTAPGQVFARTINGGDRPFIKVGVSIDSPRRLVVGQTSDLSTADILLANEKAEAASWAAEKAEREAAYQAKLDRSAETDRAIAEALNRIAPLLAEMGIHPDTLSAGSAGGGRKGILMPAEAAERLVRMALDAERMYV